MKYPRMIILAPLLVSGVLLLQGCLPVGVTSPRGAATQPISHPQGGLATSTAVSPAKPAPTPSLTPTHSAATQPQPSSGFDATYTDTLVGLALDYPGGWNITVPSEQSKLDSVIYSTTITSWQPSDAGPRGQPPPGTKLDVTVVKEPQVSLNEAVAMYRQQMAMQDANPDTIVSEETWQLAGTIPAVRWLVRSSMGEAALVITVINDYTILLAGYGDYELFDRIARTLRPLE